MTTRPEPAVCMLGIEHTRFLLRFTVTEIMESRDGIESAAVLQKVGLYVSEYVRFRQSPDQLALVGGRVSGAQTGNSSKIL